MRGLVSRSDLDRHNGHAASGGGVLKNGSKSGTEEMTYPVGATVRLTGLHPDTLRAWERRHGIVVPLRTEGGTRRYRASDLERLRQVKAAVDAGYRIGDVARLDPDELARILANQGERESSTDVCDTIVAALSRLDAEAAERLIALQLAALGPSRFARLVATPVLSRIGTDWAAGEMCIAAEHMASAVLRSVLGASLRPSTFTTAGAPILFATLPGERHELGLLVAAITAAAAGGRVVYLGADLPIEELVHAANVTGAVALALSMVASEAGVARDHVRALREQLPGEVEIWAGGSLASLIEAVPGVTLIESFDTLERSVQLTVLGSGRHGL